MSYIEKRQEIVDALNTVTAIKASTYKPSTPTPGCAWIKRGDSNRLNAIAWDDQFLIIIKLPASEAAADKWRDEHEPAIAQAIENNGIGYVDSFIPINLSSDTKVEFGLQVNFRS